LAQQHRNAREAVTGRSHIERTGRYTIIGALCALIQNAVMILGAAAGGHYAWLSVLAFAVVTPIGYFMHARFTFTSPLSWSDFLRFGLGVAAGFPLYFLAMAIMCSGLGFPVWVAGPIATVVLFFWNYVSAHLAIRSRQKFGDGRQEPERRI
jgi:putative flippase GtrA